MRFLAAFLGVLSSGLVSDRILRAGYSLGTARKLPIITGLLLSSCIVGANYVDAPELVIAFMALAFFGNGMASIGWSLISSVAPRRLIGLTGGTFNFISNAATIDEPGEIIAPWAATVEPQGLPAPLNIVDGGKARGVWTLRIMDFSPGDTGTLHCFKLRIKPGKG